MKRGYVRESGWGPTVQRFCEANGIPLPPPLTADEERAWEQEELRAEAEARRIWQRRHGRSAA